MKLREFVILSLFAIGAWFLIGASGYTAAESHLATPTVTPTSIAPRVSAYTLAADNSSVFIDSVRPEPPYCVLRNSPNPYDRLLRLTGHSFPTSGHHLQFRRVADAATTIHFGMEVNWEGSTTISVDMASIKHLLWSDNKVALQVRLTGSGYHPVSDWSSEFILADDDAACGVVDNGWTTFRDEVYGYKIHYPASWHVYPADGSPGSMTTLSSFYDQETDISADAVRIQIGLAIYDRNPKVSLQDWVVFPPEIASRIPTAHDRPSVFTDELVIQSYSTSEDTFRRAYIARGQKVYFIDMIPDVATQYGLFTAIVQSLTFTDPVQRDQDVTPQLFGFVHPHHVFVPLVMQTGERMTTSLDETVVTQRVPANYRLPFVGDYQITQGPYYNPGCTYSHKDYGNGRDDREAIDFGIPAGTLIYASESGVLKQGPSGSYGNVVWITHEDGRISWYAHLNSFENEPGRVSREAIIGRSGTTRFCKSGPCSWPAHLHFMIQEPNTTATEWIRTLPGITWYSGDPNYPCNTGPDHRAPAGYYYDGYAVGPPLSGDTPPTTCRVSLSSPSDGLDLSSPTVGFSWNSALCATGGYIFRVKTVAEMEQGGTTLQHISTDATQRSITIGSQWYDQDLYWSVKPANIANASWAPARRFRIMAVPPSQCPASNLNSPAAGVAFTSGTVIFNWSEVSCHHSGFVFRIKTVSDMESGGATVVDAVNGTTQRTQTIGSEWYDRDLYWSVKAANAANAAWSPSRRFRIAPTAIAARPSLSSPSNGSSMPQNTDVTLRWNSASGATQYKVELWGGSYSLMTVCDWQSSTSCHIGQMWPGTLSWRVRARNSSGQESEWSDTWTFIVQQTTPTVDAPALSSPSNGLSMPQNTDVTLRWNSSSDATQYTVELWGGPYSRMTVCEWQSGASCHIGQMWPGTMNWRVKARGASGQESVWSSTWSFTIQEAPSGPSAPTLSSPANGASMAQSTDVTLAWNTSSGATQYKVEVWGGPYSLMVPCDWQSGTSCHIGQMWPGTMNWRVRARNTHGESAWSSTWSFTIQEAAPAWKPTLSSPANGSSMAQSTAVTLRWNTLSDATQYKVEVWGGPYSLMVPCDWQSGTSCQIGQMWPGTMSWRVRARNSSGQQSEWSDTWTFIIQD